MVDDSRPIVVALARAFARAGFRVLTGMDGNEAMAMARRHTLDAAVVDQRMPGPSGLEVLSYLRSSQPRAIRVLASGGLDMDLAIQAVNRGRVSHVVRKPFKAQSIVEVVQAALAERAEIDSRGAAAAGSAHRAERDDLLELLGSDLLELAIQPIVSASTGQVRAVEALLRSSHPRLAGPAEVLAAAERHGMIGHLADRLAWLAAQWCHELPISIQMFLNIHPLELRDPDALRARIEPLRPYAGRVVTEITERAQLPAPELRERSLGILSRAGFALAVDDLGAGYNALGILASLNPSYVKIDMSIVRGVDKDARKQELMRLLCDYARRNKASVVAEGIETGSEAAMARVCGASWLQGFLFGRPRTRVRSHQHAA